MNHTTRTTGYFTFTFSFTYYYGKAFLGCAESVCTCF